MSSVVISGDTSGAITLASPAVAGTNTATLPAATGTVMVSGNMPAFSAYQSSAQTLTNSVITKLLFQTEEFDTNNNFASSTFTPTVAGYYQINSFVYSGNTAGTFSLFLYKNGSNYKRIGIGQQSTGCNSNGAALVYLNGSTDYVEIYGSQTSGGSVTIPFALSDLVWFQGVLVRSA